MIKILYLQYINRQAVWLNYDIVLYLVVCTVLNFLLICNVHSGNHSCNWWYLEIIYLFLFICLVNCYLYNYLLWHHLSIWYHLVFGCSLLWRLLSFHIGRVFGYVFQYRTFHVAGCIGWWCKGQYMLHILFR